jgi:hypothetical protein
MDSWRVNHASLMVNRKLWASKDADARLSMSMSLVDANQMRSTMRTVFNVEIKCDLPANDEERRKTFIKLMLQTTRLLYTQSTMLSTNIPVELAITMEDRNGVEELDLFEPTTDSEGK